MDNALFIIIGTAGFILLASVVIFLLISHQKKVWKEQHKLQQLKIAQQKELMRAMIETQEKERARIAQDLHDDIGGLAMSLKVNNDAISDYVNDGDQLKRIKEKTEMLANEIIRTGRNVSHDLLPPIIKKCGLVEAVKTLAEDLSDPENTAIQFNTNRENVELDGMAEVSLYRVMNEWIHNVLKHSGASLLAVNIEVNGNILSLTAKDNGKDFNFEEAKARSKGLGLMNLEGRLDHLNADFSFEKNGKNGTTLHIQYQLNPA